MNFHNFIVCNQDYTRLEFYIIVDYVTLIFLKLMLYLTLGAFIMIESKSFITFLDVMVIFIFDCSFIEAIGPSVLLQFFIFTQKHNHILLLV